MARFTFSLGFALFACAMGHQQAWAADTCETIRQSIGGGPGQLINLDTHKVAGQFGTPTPPILLKFSCVQSRERIEKSHVFAANASTSMSLM
jgi:hypothetical protein